MMSIVVVEMNAARGVVAVIGNGHLLGLSTFATALLTSLAIAAGTDYAIFLVGRYQEARQSGEDREAAYYTAFRGVGHVILGSGLTVAGAMLCLHFTRLNYFSSMGIPSAIALVIVVAGSLTLAPAVLVVASRFGRFEPRKKIESSRMETNRRRRGALARTDFGSLGRDRSRRPVGPSWIHDQL